MRGEDHPNLKIATELVLHVFFGLILDNGMRRLMHEVVDEINSGLILYQEV